MAYNLPIVYAPGGVDYRLPHPLRDVRAAVDGLNFDISANQALVKRQGYQMKALDDLGYGLAVFDSRQAVELDVNGWGQFDFGIDEFGSPTSLGLGDVQEKLVGFSELPKIWNTGTLDITYSGSGTAVVNIQCNDSGDIVIDVTVDGSSVASMNAGDGTAVGAMTVTTVQTTINAVADFSAALTTTDATVPAAFLDFHNSYTLTQNIPYTVGFGFWGDMNCPTTTPLTDWYARRSREDFENPTYLNMNGVLYINNGFDGMWKYDDQNLYLAGLPQSVAPSTALDTGTAVSAGMSGLYQYRVQYVQVDNMLNTLAGRASSASVALDNSAGPYAIDVTVTNLDSTTGYNTNCAIVQGAQTSVNAGTGKETLTVDDGAGGAHTLKAGDKAYFYSLTSSEYVTLDVDSVATNTITVKSATGISVADNTVISNNLKIEIYRTEASGTTYKLVDTIPNNSFSSTQVYSDTLGDIGLGALLGTPNSTKSTPPNCKYGVVWKNQMILAGDPSAPDTVYYSEFDDETNPENFPVLNSFTVSQQLGTGTIKGLAVLGEDLIIFTEEATYSGTGNLATDSITVDIVSDNVGCVAQHTVKVVDNQCFFLSKQGVYRIRPGGFRNYLMDKISGPIDTVFQVGANNNFEDAQQRALAVVWQDARKYILALPDQTSLSGEWYANSGTRLYALDLDRGHWMPWSNMLAIGGMVVFDDDGGENTEQTLWFHTRELVSGVVKKRLYRMNFTHSEIDFVDHTDPVNMSYTAQWEFGNSPRVKKLYNEMALDTFRGSSGLAYTPTGTATVDIYRDFDNTTSEVQFTVDFIAVDKEIIKGLPWSQKRAIGAKFSNNVRNKQILINGWTYESMSYRREIRR